MSNKTIVIQRIWGDEASRLQHDIIQLNEAVKKLWDIKELAPVPMALNDITQDWIKERVKQPVYIIKKDASLTEQERKQRLNAWRAIRTRAERYVAVIEQVLNDWPEVVFSVNSDSLDEWGLPTETPDYTVADEQLEAVTKARATREIPDEADEHYSLICKCVEAAKGLREFEKSHDLRFYPLEVLARWSFDDVAERWVLGSIKNDRRFKYVTPVQGTSLF